MTDAKRLYMKKYRRTKSGIESRHRSEQKPGRKEYLRLYAQSPKGKAMRKIYKGSLKYKEYLKTPNAKAASRIRIKRYSHSPKGKETRRRWMNIHYIRETANYYTRRNVKCRRWAIKVLKLNMGG